MSMKINLLPKEYRPQPVVSIPRMAFVLVFILALFGTGVWLASEWMTSIRTTENIAKVDQDIQLYGQQYQSVMLLEQQQTEIKRKWDEIKGVLAPFIPVDKYLSEIIAPLPDNVWIKALSIDATGNIVIDGRSDRMKAVAIYLIDIENSPLFMNTNLQVIDNPTANGIGDVFGFKLTFAVDKAGLVK